MSLPVIAVVSLLVAVVCTPLAIRLARRTGTMDRPGDLKSQAAPVPYLGGLAVFAGTAVGVAVARPSLLVPLAGGLVLGVVDDRIDLPPLVRLASQVAIGIAVVATCPVRFPGPAAAVLIVVVTIVLVNGVNLLDGLDLLAGGVAAVAAFAFCLLQPGTGRQVALALGAALVGFLLFNRPPARIYLGDGGAYLVGTALTVLVAEAWGPGIAPAVGAASLALVAVPAAEVAWAVVRRGRGRHSLLAGDRGHPYDRLVERGWPPIRASLAYAGGAAVLAAPAVVSARHHALGAAVVVDIAAGAVLLLAAGATGALAPDSGARP